MDQKRGSCFDARTKEERTFRLLKKGPAKGKAEAESLIFRGNSFVFRGSIFRKYLPLFFGGLQVIFQLKVFDPKSYFCQKLKVEDFGKLELG